MDNNNNDHDSYYLSGDRIRIAVVGDLHTYWDHMDLAYFNHSDYDMLFFTGDLGGGTAGSSLNIAKSITQLQKPTLVMPGNNDVTDAAAMSAEFAHQKGLDAVLSPDVERSPDGVKFCGYSAETILAGGNPRHDAVI